MRAHASHPKPPRTRGLNETWAGNILPFPRKSPDFFPPPLLPPPTSQSSSFFYPILFLSILIFVPSALVPYFRPFVSLSYPIFLTRTDSYSIHRRDVSSSSSLVEMWDYLPRLQMYANSSGSRLISSLFFFFSFFFFFFFFLFLFFFLFFFFFFFFFSWFYLTKNIPFAISLFSFLSFSFLLLSKKRKKNLRDISLHYYSIAIIHIKSFDFSKLKFLS